MPCSDPCGAAVRRGEVLRAQAQHAAPSSRWQVLCLRKKLPAWNLAGVRRFRAGSRCSVLAARDGAGRGAVVGDVLGDHDDPEGDRAAGDGEDAAAGGGLAAGDLAELDGQRAAGGGRAGDAALLLARALMPGPMRPGWSDALRLARSVLPHQSLTAIDERLAAAAAWPVTVPSRGRSCATTARPTLSATFRTACRSLGVSLVPAHPDTPTDKPVIERPWVRSRRCSPGMWPATLAPASSAVTALVPILQTFFTERLAQQRHASPRTIAAYRGHLAAAARLRLGEDSQAARPSGSRRSGRTADRHVPGPPRS
jgi:hypothetical protein